MPILGKNGNSRASHRRTAHTHVTGVAVYPALFPISEPFDTLLNTRLLGTGFISSPTVIVYLAVAMIVKTVLGEELRYG